MKRTIRIDGTTYEVRYTYQKEDGTVWNVLLGAEGFYGEFGDEWPESQVVGRLG